MLNNLKITLYPLTILAIIMCNMIDTYTLHICKISFLMSFGNVNANSDR